MVNKENCKIVQDLLPNYVEKLTSNTTNIFIEEHLEKCSECTSILENMKKDFEKENNNIEKEINYAKKYNSKFKKMKCTLLLVIYSMIFIIIAFSGILYFKEKNVSLYNADTGKKLEEVKIPEMTHIIEKGKIPNSYTYINIYTFDKSDVVVNIRYINQFETVEEATNYYNSLQDNVMFSNISISNTTVMCNFIANGLSKSKILDNISSSEEILEY